MGTVAVKPHAALAEGTIYLPTFWSRKQRLRLFNRSGHTTVSDGAGIHPFDRYD